MDREVQFVDSVGWKMSESEDFGISRKEAAEHDRAMKIINEFDDFRVSLKLIGWVLQQSAKVPNDGKFSNATAAMAAFARAFHDIQAAISLCQIHCYPQALGLMRSVYEAAGIGRTMAKSINIADKWLLGEWQPDAKSRQFVRNVMHADSEVEEREEAVAAYSESYELLSKWAHVTAVSALVPYVEDSEDGYSVTLEPKFDEERLKFTLTIILKESVFLAYAVRNSVARLEVLGEEWLKELEALGTRVAGSYVKKLDIDYEELEQRRKKLAANIRSSSEHKRHMKRSPESVDNLLRESGKDF